MHCNQFPISQLVYSTNIFNCLKNALVVIIFCGAAYLYYWTGGTNLQFAAITTDLKLSSKSHNVYNQIGFWQIYGLFKFCTHIPNQHEVSRQPWGTLQPLSQLAPSVLGLVFEASVWTLCYQPPGKWVTAFICHNTCNWYESMWLIQKLHTIFHKLVSETSLRVKNNFNFPLFQIPSWLKYKSISIIFGRVQLILQKSHLTEPDKFTEMHQSCHKYCFRGRFHSHLLVCHVVN